jgi:hypothetical protein
MNTYAFSGPSRYSLLSAVHLLGLSSELLRVTWAPEGEYSFVGGGDFVVVLWTEVCIVMSFVK